MTKAILPPYDYDIIIIGGGPAGYTAGIYAARAALKTLLIEGAGTVSQITITDMIENYPGIPDGIGGYELMQLFKKQALKFGLDIEPRDVTSIKKVSDQPVIWEVTAGNLSFKALSVIVATGAMWRSLGIPRRGGIFRTGRFLLRHVRRTVLSQPAGGRHRRGRYGHSGKPCS